MSNKEARNVLELALLFHRKSAGDLCVCVSVGAAVNRGKVQRILRLINDPRNRWFITDLPYTSSNVSCQVINYTD